MASAIIQSADGTPPIPAALVMIENRHTHERFVKLLRNANIELDEATTRVLIDDQHRPPFVAVSDG